MLSPLSPFSSSGPRVFDHRRRSARSRTDPSSSALARHLGVLTFHGPPSYLEEPFPIPLFQKRLASAFRPHSICGAKGPSQKLTGFSPWVPAACLASGKSRSQGLATLSARLSTLRPLEAFFSSQRSRASPFRALLLSGDREKVSLPLSAPALPCETSRPRIGASAASSHLRSRTPYCLPGFLRRVGASCSLGPSDLSGSPPIDPPEVSSPHLRCPSRPSIRNALRRTGR